MNEIPENLSVILLAKLADRKIGSVDERETLSNIALREKVAKHLLILFLGTNLSVLTAIVFFALVDYHISGEVVARATTQPAAFEKLLGSADLLEKSDV